MQLVDVHCHLESDAFEAPLETVLDEARQAGIVKLVTASVTPAQWAVSASLAARYEEVECALGVHPWYLKPEHEAELEGLYAAKARGAVAIGEVGLDRKSESTPFALQERFFETQLRIAKEIGLPLVIHCRGAFNELMASVRRIGLPGAGGVIHNYSGSAELALQLAAMGLRFSVGGTLTYRNSRKRRETLRAIYPDHFLLETDSPDIPPVEARDRPNVPANILHNLRAAAEILGESEERVAAQTTANAARVFGLAL